MTPPEATSPRRRTSGRRWAAYAVATLVGLGALGTALDPADGGAPIASKPPVDPTERPAVATTRPVTTAPVPAFGPSGETEVATLLRVVDGDTIRVMLNGEDTPVRYIGIDTPEPDDPDPDQRALADAATAANAALLEGHELILERDVSDVDTFGRILRYVWIDDGGDLTLVNRELVRRGFATASSYPPDVAHDGVLAEAQEEARRAGAGMWAPESTAAPTRTPIATIDHTPISIDTDARERFQGGIGSTTWSALFFVADRVTVRWSVSASSQGDCRVAWRLEPADGDVINSTVRVSGGESELGNRRYDTPFTDAALAVDSTCGLWKMSMEGYEAAPQPISGGGGNCDSSYPDFCVPPFPPDLDCSWVYAQGASHITVRGSDPHGFDGDNDGVGCESP
jgi:endonuclease YncB( thermonuclease family)